ncbi:hypothetical protein GM418_27370 [Maribellus comscasis]|uniref:DUF4365 domain-containing protein n=1 Tax=Maribellus comscasis TaxID=2681766 RepID=A0A6I6K0X8_9BACT|nr:hypothetical protein [Maribellus comscasis]QGY47249.1 hypothetical protein GM418_27370 [Maribellus comscasis]
MDKIYKYAQHFVKLELMKARFEVFENESGSRGVDFIIKSKSGKYYEISLHTLNLENVDRSIKIPQTDWNYELPDNLLIALVLFMKKMEPAVFLIPCKVLKEPDNRFFFNNEQDERFKYLSNWEIKIFTNGIKELSEKYALVNTANQLD